MGTTEQRRRRRALVICAVVALVAVFLFPRPSTDPETEPAEARQLDPLPASAFRAAPPPPVAEVAVEPEPEPEPDADCEDIEAQLARMALESYEECGMPAYLAGCLSRPAPEGYVSRREPVVRELVQEACGRPAVATDCSELPCLATLPEGCEPGFEGQGLVAQALDRSDDEGRAIVYFSHDDRTALVGFADLVRRRFDRAQRYAPHGGVGVYQRTEAVCGEAGRAVARGEGPDCAAIALLNGCDPDEVEASPPPNAPDVEDWVDRCPELDNEEWGLDCSVSPCLLTLNGEFERPPCEGSLPDGTLVRKTSSIDLFGGVMSQFYLQPPDSVLPRDWMSKHWPAASFREHAQQYVVLHGAPPMVDGHLMGNLPY